MAYKKKIVFVIDSLSSGGAEKSLISLLSIFDYSKYDVDLLMFTQKGLYLSLVPDNVNILEPPLFSKLQNKSIKYLLKKGKYKQLYIRLRTSIDVRNMYLKRKFHGAQITWRWTSKIIENIDNVYDVAIAYSQGMPTYYVADKIKAKKKVCWINTDYKKAPYNPSFDIKYYEKFNEIISVSEIGRTSFIEKLPSMKQKTKVIYDIISPKLIKLMSYENNGFNEVYFGIKILTIGRLVHLKGYDIAIEAAYKLKKEGIEFKWYVIGEGELKKNLEALISKYSLEENFIFLGATSNPYTYLRNIDIYVQPSRYEGFGIAIAEAKILQKPIVATNFDVVYNQLKHEENGLVVDMNSTALYRGIKKLIYDEQLRNSLINNLSKEVMGTEEQVLKIYDIIDYDIN